MQVLVFFVECAICSLKKKSRDHIYIKTLKDMSYVIYCFKEKTLCLVFNIIINIFYKVSVQQRLLFMKSITDFFFFSMSKQFQLVWQYTPYHIFKNVMFYVHHLTRHALFGYHLLLCLVGVCYPWKILNYFYFIMSILYIFFMYIFSYYLYL